MAADGSDFDDDCYDDEDDYEYEDDEDDTMGDDDVLDSNALMEQQKDTKRHGVRMIPASDFLPEMKRYVEETTEITGLSSDVVMVLLNQCHWSKDKLVEEYYADPDAVLKKYGAHYHVHPRDKADTANDKEKKASKKQSHKFRRFMGLLSAEPELEPEPKIKTCAICYDDEEPECPFPAMACGHAFCTSCWDGYVSNAIDGDGPMCVRTLKCPESKCQERLTMGDVAMALPGEERHRLVREKYELFQLRSFIDACELTCWCPGSGCTLVAAASSLYELECANKEATCGHCELSFCVSCCGEEAHSPCRCSILKMWKEKCQSDGMNATWLMANTKSCPKCHRRIQKNGGCNHMTCRSGCGYEFCWLCFGEWNSHRACNRLREGDDRDRPNDDEALNARTELERYTHYQDRYRAHDHGQKYAQKKWKELKAKEATEDILWDKVVLARDANKLLTTCRRVLKYTYAYGYTVFGVTNIKSLQKERFEDRQQQLESFTERLSGETEKANMNDIDPTKVVDLSGVLAVFIKNMIESADDEMDDDLQVMKT